MLHTLHPAIVHFPVALLLCALLAELVWLWRKADFWRDMAFWLLLGGTLGTGAAALTGGWAEDSLTMSNTLHEAVEQHETIGYILVWLYACLLVWKILRRQTMPAAENRIFLGALLVATVLLVYSGWLGGELVYEYGAGVKGVTIDLPQNNPTAPTAP
jgi:uncharacterized membrane protein